MKQSLVNAFPKVIIATQLISFTTSHHMGTHPFGVQQTICYIILVGTKNKRIESGTHGLGIGQ
jgi:hypothetical protein